MAMKDRFQSHDPIVLGLVFTAVMLTGASRSPIDDRVPEVYMEKAIALQAPFGDARQATQEIVAAGKILYEGKGTCSLSWSEWER